MKISRHFSREEFACACGCGFDTVDIELVEDILEIIREHFQSAVTINTGCRCRKHNREEGGGKKSQHIFARAADIEVAGIAAHVVQNFIEATWPHQYGLGRYADFTHIDSRAGKARWRG